MGCEMGTRWHQPQWLSEQPLSVGPSTVRSILRRAVWPRKTESAGEEGDSDCAAGRS